MNTVWADMEPTEVLEFWFPDNGHQDSIETHAKFWEHRMRGGVDDEIRERFAALTEAAACGLLDHWAETPRGRLALIIALDQFPRSVWRGTPAAYAQDIKATRLALEGKDNGHFEALAHPWEKQFYNIAIGHCEGPDHLARMHEVVARSGASRHPLPNTCAGSTSTVWCTTKRCATSSPAMAGIHTATLYSDARRLRRKRLTSPPANFRTRASGQPISDGRAQNIKTPEAAAAKRSAKGL